MEVVNHTIKVALADDETLFRKAMQLLLEHDMGIEVLFEVGDGNALLSNLRNSRYLPDIILMDIMMPSLDGFEIAKIICKEFPEIKIIALSSHSSNSFISKMISVGSSSYLVKNTKPLEVLQTINEVFKHGFHYNRKVLEVLRAHINPNKQPKGYLNDNHLTSREIDVLKLICLQKNGKEIADELFISQRTVEGHRNNLMLKTGSRNIAGLAIYAIKNSLFDSEDCFGHP